MKDAFHGVDYFYLFKMCLVHRFVLMAQKINFCGSFAGQLVGVKEVEEGVWLVSFMNYDIGYFDVEIKKVEPIENPFGPGLLPMSPV